MRTKSSTRLLSSTALACLPIFGFVLFFEITRPTISYHENNVAKRLAEIVWPNRAVASAKSVSSKPHAITGVSAELKQAPATPRLATLLNDLPRRLSTRGDNQDGYQAGFKAAYLAEDGRPMMLKIMRRELLSDREVPSNDVLGRMTLASGTGAGAFAMGAWLYTFEIEEIKASHPIVVQESL